MGGDDGDGRDDTPPEDDTDPAKSHDEAEQAWPSPMQQISAAREAAMKHMLAPFRRRAREREATVERRDRYRSTTDYGELEQRMQSLLTSFRDRAHFAEFAREYYVAGVSGIPPRRGGERWWVFDEDARRSEHRAEIIRVAKDLDGIDAAGGFDSASEYDYGHHAPPLGDDHCNRAWQDVLEADIARLAHILTLRKTSWSAWLGRSAARYSPVLLLTGVGVVVSVLAGVSVWSAASWIATVCSVPIIWRTSHKRKDAFVECVSDLQSEHYRALALVRRHLAEWDPKLAPKTPFERDPSRSLLSELLQRRFTGD